LRLCYVKKRYEDFLIRRNSMRKSRKKLRVGVKKMKFFLLRWWVCVRIGEIP